MVSRMIAALVLAVGQVPLSEFDPDRAVIFSAGDGTRQIAQCSRKVPGPVGGSWTPDKETIRRLEAVLAPALQEAINREQPDESKRQAASGYYRQYFGVVVDGHRIVYVNGFHELFLKLSSKSRPLNWRDEAVNVCDGWTLFFWRGIRSGVAANPTPSL